MSFWPQFCAIVFLSVSCASYIFRHVVSKILKKEMDQTLHVCHAWSTHWLNLATCKDCVTEWTELYGWSPRNCHCLLVMYLGRERQGTQGVGRGHRDGRVYSSAQSQQSISTIIIKKENKEAVTWPWILITLLERGLQLLLCYTNCLIQAKSLALLAGCRDLLGSADLILSSVNHICTD